jgi:L-fuconolactonase
MIIDSHQHFWRYDPAEFGWISDEMAAIRRDFSAEDSRAEIAKHHVDTVIAVQARQNLEETQQLLALAKRTDFIRGVVGWLPLASPQVDEVLAKLADSSNLVGARHVLQGESDAFFGRDEFNQGLRELTRHNLTYDLLVTERQLPVTIALVDRHATQTFVIDHLAKPDISGPPSANWKRGMLELARRENVACKISGGITEADLKWTPQRIIPLFDVALEAFGPARLLFGSNWPVSEACGGFAMWMQTVRQWAAKLSANEQAQIFGETASRVYRLRQQTC